MNPVSRRDEGLSRISRVTRWSIVGALAATASVSAVVANAQPGRSTTNASTSVSTGGVVDNGAAGAAPANMPPATATTTPGTRRSRTSPAVPAPTRRSQKPAVTTSGGS